MAQRGKFALDVLSRAGIQLVLQLRNLIFLPLIAKNLDATAFGAWTQITVTLNLAAPVIMLRLEMATVRYLASKRESDLRDEFFTMALVVWGLALAIAAIGLGMSDRVGFLLFSAGAPIVYAQLFLILLLIRVGFRFMLNYYRARNEIRRYSAIEFGVHVFSIALAIALMAFGYGLPGVLAALIVVEGMTGLGVLTHVLYRVGRPQRLAWGNLARYLRYSLPLLPNRALFWVLNFSDRYLITHLLSLSQAGVYAASYALGNVATLARSPISFVLLPTVSELFDRGDLAAVKRYMRESVHFFLMLSIPSAAGLFHFGPQILRILATTEFVPSRWLILFILLGLLMLGLHQIFIYVVHLYERTRWLPLVTVVSAALNVALNLWLVPELGILGAAIGTFTAYALQTALIVGFASRLLAIDLDTRLILKILLASLGMYGALQFWAASGLWGLLGGVGIGAVAYFALLIALRGLGPREWHWVRALWTRPHGPS